MTQVLTSYLGFPMVVSEDHIWVRTPEGRLVAAVTSVKQARLVIRGYRKAARAEA